MELNPATGAFVPRSRERQPLEMPQGLERSRGTRGQNLSKRRVDSASTAESTMGLCSGFIRSSEEFPERPALEVEGQTLTYRQLRDKAESIAATLLHWDEAADPPLTAIFAYRSVVAFGGVLGALFRGHGYVPLNRTFPPERTRTMLDRSECRAVVVDQASALQLDRILPGIARPLTLLLPETQDVSALSAQWPQHRILGAKDLLASPTTLPLAATPDAIAYLLFTSGSTGTPKGVMIAQQNVLSYLDFVVPRYQLNEGDRCSQTFDMTFDLSAHDMFVTWESGACLCCPTQKGLIKPGGFIVDSRLTTWFSVPSTAVFMKKLGMLKPGMYPGLRLSLFCGEALPMEVAKGWSETAPNSILENIYGPTELTIACTAYRWDRERSPAECELGVVPIGEPMKGMEALLVDESLREVPTGTPGELLMAGPQMAPGYWRDPEKTAKAFLVPPDQAKTYYRTGDRVRRSAPAGPMLYLGRVDNQIKVLGHRVELGEVEAAVREASGIDGVVAVGWPKSSGGADGIEVFLQTDAVDRAALTRMLTSRLPSYMMPRRIHCLPIFPVNSNGKFDRQQLTKILETIP
jgi:amino acid adenylation domain-containing protein